MIKNAGELISAAQELVQCLDVASAKALYDESENAVVIDVREADSAAKSKLENSINISRGLLEMKIPPLYSDPDTVIITHCGGGGRATLAALTLTQMGYTSVYAITAKYEDIKEIFG